VRARGGNVSARVFEQVRSDASSVRALQRSPRQLAAAWGAFGANSTQANSALFDLLVRRYVIGARFSL
jgi:hypothetical protein